MSKQKNKAVLAATLAIISVFLLGGVSLSFFPNQQTTQQDLPATSHIMWTRTPAADVNLTLIGPVSTSTGIYGVLTGIYGPTGAISSVGACNVPPPPDSIIIKEDGSVNSTALRCQGNTYTFTSDITNQTLVIQKSGVIVNGANHTLIFNGTFTSKGGIIIENLQGVTIEDFNFSSPESFVSIRNSTGIVVNNNNFNNVDTGIILDSSSNCRIIQNNFVNTHSAVFSYQKDGNGQSQNNVVSNNTIHNAFTSGIVLKDISSSVTDNVFINSWNSVYGGVNATIARNTFINGSCAIQVASYNQIYDNKLTNLYDEGIELSGFNSSIYRNTITNCSSAIMIFGPNSQIGGNTIWHNNFVNNTQLFTLYYTWTFPTNNYWDNGKEGNYWTSYNGSDSNGDGIGDTPFDLATNCTDNSPLMQPYTTTLTNAKLGNLFFAAAAITALIGAAVIICVYTKFRK